MKKFINFCKSYLAEISAILSTILLIGIFIFYRQHFAEQDLGIFALIGMCFAVLEMCLMSLASCLPCCNRKSFKITRYLCFALLMLVFITDIHQANYESKALLYIFAISGMAFCALYSDFLIVTRQRTKAKKSPAERPADYDVTHIDDGSTNSESEENLGDEFDLLCLIDGHKARVPFSSRHLGEPIGIFPFKNSREYIELDEQENKRHTDACVDEKRLLTEEFSSYVFKIKNKLNIYLKALGKPILSGTYLADSSYMHRAGWIVGFDDNEKGNLTSDYYGGNTPAKLRYMGKY